MTEDTSFFHGHNIHVEDQLPVRESEGEEERFDRDANDGDTFAHRGRNSLVAAAAHVTTHDSNL